MIRNPLSLSENPPLAALCDEIGELTKRPQRTGDRHSAAVYYRGALALACEGLALRGDWPSVDRFCVELDRIDGGASGDASYFRLLFPLLHGDVTADLLDGAITARQREDTRGTSTLCADGRHLDALIAGILTRWKGSDTADRYRRMCSPWTDLFFDHSQLRTAIWADTAHQCANGTVHTPYRRRNKTISAGKIAINRSHTKIRAHFEPSVATLKPWRLLPKLRCSTTRITQLVRVALTLHLACSD